MSNTSANANKAWEDAVARVAKLDRKWLTWGGLALAAIVLLCINVVSDALFRGAKADLTNEGLYTISSGTRKVLTNIDEPISLQVYYSKQLGVAAPTYGKYFERVRALLEQYRDISGGRVNLEFIDPEPFSDAEDRAVAAGLKGVRINREGETAYFGMVGANSTDNTALVEFFSPERERFLEYDISKIIFGLANPKKRVVGLITSLPLNGKFMPQGGTLPPWQIMEQIRDFFEVKEIAADAKEIPVDVDVLMLAQADRLSDQLLYAIDQYALKGGRILAMVDPVSEMSGPGQMGMLGPMGATAAIDKLLKAWGVEFDQSKVAADLASARRVQFGGSGGKPVITEFVAWLSLDQSRLDQGDVLSGGIERLNLASAGTLNPVKDAKSKFQPILTTTDKAMLVDADKLKFRPDPVALIREYKTGSKQLVLAARVTGEAASAFPDGAPKPKADEKKDEAKAPADPKSKAAAPEAAPSVKSGNVNVVVIADTDLMHEQFWAEVRDFAGQRLVIPVSQNAAFVLNALESLSGGEVMSGLRGRGIEDRPFDLVDRIRRDAERRFREKEQALVDKLKNVQQQLTSLETKGDGKIILSDKDRQSIDTFRREMIDIRRELRDVKHALRKDIDRVDGWLKLVNIAGVPILLGLGGLFVAWRRRRVSQG